MKPLLIAQISDIHLRAGRTLAYGKVDTAAFLEQAVAHLQQLDPQPDAIVVTGDLGDYGTDEEYELFREITGALAPPLHVIPGNHDSERLWKAFPDDADRRQGDNLGYHVDIEGLRLILFDSHVEGEHHGLATAERCEWLSDCLLHRPSPALLFMHHPPFLTGISHMDINNCREAERLEAVVGRSQNLLAIGSGHVHRMIVSSVGGHLAVIAPSVAHAVSFDLHEHAPATFSMEPPGYLLHRIDRSGARWSHSVHRIFTENFAGPYAFFTEDGQLT